MESVIFWIIDFRFVMGECRDYLGVYFSLEEKKDS